MGHLNRAIVCCACGGTPTYSRIQFKIKHPDDPEPPIYIGSNRGSSLLETFPSPSEARSFLSSVLKKREDYSYLIEWDDSYHLTHVWNYQTNKEVR